MVMEVAWFGGKGGKGVNTRLYWALHTHTHTHSAKFRVLPQYNSESFRSSLLFSLFSSCAACRGLESTDSIKGISLEGISETSCSVYFPALAHSASTGPTVSDRTSNP